VAILDILDQISKKGADIGAIADRLIKNSRQIPAVVKALQTEKSAKKFAYEKTLRLISERAPGLVYPFFDVFVELLDSDNSFLKWGAIISVANLTVVDSQNRFETVFRKYYAPICGPTMVTAANIIGGSSVIARAKPDLVDSITNELLKVEKAKFLTKGMPSPECRNVAIGQAIDSFDEFYNLIGLKTKVMGFVRRQLKNTRIQVVRKAERFIKKHGMLEEASSKRKSAAKPRRSGSGFSHKQKTV